MSLCVHVHLQVAALFGVGGVPDDRTEGPGEARRLGPHLHHLRSQRHHWKPGVRTLSAVQSRGEFPLPPLGVFTTCFFFTP